MPFKFSIKGQQLIKLYTEMVSGGYMRKDELGNEHNMPDVFSDFESRFYRVPVKEQFKKFLEFGWKIDRSSFKYIFISFPI